MHKYYVINNDEDGDVRLEVLSREKLEEMLAENYWGKDVEVVEPKGWLDLRQSSGIIIIKGEAITPKPVDVVKSWSVGD